MHNNNIEKYGFTNFFKEQINHLKLSEMDLKPARITEVHKEQYKIITHDSEKAAKLKGSLFYQEADVIYPTVGDFVLVKGNPLGDDIIYHVLERKSKFSRLDTWNKIEQIVAANFDYVFIMVSLNYDLSNKRIERYLAAAWQSGASPVIVLTKSDLCENSDLHIQQLEEIAIGVPIIAISSLTGEGLEGLMDYLQPSKTAVFLGSSGVGKSSLVNALAGEEIMDVNTIREDDSKGRHTTTHRQLIKLNNGAFIIDTPGMRELGMWDISEGLELAFNEIDELAKNCKFRDCSHENEPGCGVKAALENGELSEERWDNYIKLKKEARFAQGKEDINIRLQDLARSKSIAKIQKEMKKRR